MRIALNTQLEWNGKIVFVYANGKNRKNIIVTDGKYLYSVPINELNYLIKEENDN